MIWGTLSFYILGYDRLVHRFPAIFDRFSLVNALIVYLTNFFLGAAITFFIYLFCNVFLERCFRNVILVVRRLRDLRNGTTHFLEWHIERDLIDLNFTRAQHFLPILITDAIYLAVAILVCNCSLPELIRIIIGTSYGISAAIAVYATPITFTLIIAIWLISMFMLRYYIPQRADRLRND